MIESTPGSPSAGAGSTGRTGEDRWRNRLLLSSAARCAQGVAGPAGEAPAEYAEALLDSYELLQQLHEARVFEVLRGVLSASDKVVETAVSATQIGVDRALRNAIILGKMLGSINPELMQCYATAVGETLAASAKAGD
jgi:hypothetical protein